MILNILQFVNKKWKVMLILFYSTHMLSLKIQDKKSIVWFFHNMDNNVTQGKPYL